MEHAWRNSTSTCIFLVSRIETTSHLPSARFRPSTMGRVRMITVSTCLDMPSSFSLRSLDEGLKLAQLKSIQLPCVQSIVFNQAISSIPSNGNSIGSNGTSSPPPPPPPLTPSPAPPTWPICCPTHVCVSVRPRGAQPPRTGAARSWTRSSMPTNRRCTGQRCPASVSLFVR